MWAGEPLRPDASGLHQPTNGTLGGSYADTMTFTGVSAFPLTPFVDDRIDEQAYAGIVRRVAASSVSSITALGSTGSYAYLSREERAAALRIAVENSGEKPVLAGVGATRTRHVIEHVADATEAGADGVLLAPVSYQPLSDDEVLGLFRDVAGQSELPIVVYDNPRTTGYAFTPEMYARVAEIDGIASIKIPGVPAHPEAAAALVSRIRSMIPEHVTIGVSGDAFAAAGKAAGSDAWYSVLAGTLPDEAVRLWQTGEDDLQELWEIYAEAGGGLRVMAAIAEQFGLVRRPGLPRPLIGLDDEVRERLAGVLARA